MTSYDSKKELLRLKDELSCNPVLMIRETATAEDQAALDLITRLGEPRIVRRPQETIGNMVLPRLVAGQSSYEGLDDIRGFVEYLSRLSETPVVA